MATNDPPEPAFEYIRDDDRLLVTVLAHRPLTVGELLSVVNRQIDDKAWAYGILYDYRKTSDAMSRQDSAVVSAYVHQQVRLLGPRGPVAFVVASGQVLDIVRSYARDAQGFEARMFRDIDAAVRWLTERPSPPTTPTGSS